MALAARILAAVINVVGALDPIAVTCGDRTRRAPIVAKLGTVMAKGTHRARGQFVAVQMFRLFASFRRNKYGTFRILMAEFKRGKRPSLPATGRGYGDKRKDGVVERAP